MDAFIPLCTFIAGVLFGAFATNNWYTRQR